MLKLPAIVKLSSKSLKLTLPANQFLASKDISNQPASLFRCGDRCEMLPFYIKGANPFDRSLVKRESIYYFMWGRMWNKYVGISNTHIKITKMTK